jgi:hypothetical protein
MSNFTLLAAEFPDVQVAAVEAPRQADTRLPYGNINGTI